MLDKILGNTRVWLVMGLVLLGAGSSSSTLAPARNTTTYSAMQTRVEAEMASRNAQCFASCVNTYRSRNGLKVVVLDSFGKIFTIKRFPLAPGTMLVGISPRPAPHLPRW